MRERNPSAVLQTPAISADPGISGFVILLCALIVCGCAPAQERAESSAELVSKARSAHNAGHPDQAIDLATKAIEADPASPSAYSFRASVYESAHRFSEALEDYDHLAELLPRNSDVYNQRGSAHFKAGHIDESINDFDRSIKLEPRQEPYHWQRGISYYYAGRYDAGKRQFESHQTVNSSDVENAFWHYLCSARLSGADDAREKLLPIRDDSRVPMMKIYALLHGEASVEDVLETARTESSSSQRASALFYAHLYIGLYYEARGNDALARRHIIAASEDHQAGHYMWHVARVHAERFKKRD